MSRRRICVATGTRADYGHLKWLMRDLADNPAVELQVLASAAHLSPHHGMTVQEIEADGFVVTERVEMLLAGDSRLAVAKSLGLGIIGFADALTRLAPHVLVLLGDRFEALAAAEAALVLGIPVAHIHGGEASEGTMDESIRHAITKLSHIHFVAAADYARRVVQLGEDPARVHNFGAPGLDHLMRTPLPGRAELEATIGFPLDSPLLLVTYHPTTLAGGDPAEAARQLTMALERFPAARIVLTGVNADPGASAISAVLSDYAAARPDRVRAFSSLGYRRYLGLMRLCDAVVGNSSSGIIEAPALGKPTVNIGERQAGRLMSASVIQSGPEADAIADAIAVALSDEERAAAAKCQPAYGAGDASRRIAALLASVPLEGVLVKRFGDLPGGPAP